jgi:hypothetical protein
VFVTPALQQLKLNVGPYLLGFEERYSVVRGVVGHQPIVVLAATLPPSMLPTIPGSNVSFSDSMLQQVMKVVVSRLIEIQPLLGCAVDLDVHPPHWKGHTSSATATATGMGTEAGADTVKYTVNLRAIVQMLPPHPTAVSQSQSTQPSPAEVDADASPPPVNTSPSSTERLLLHGLAVGHNMDIGTEPLWKVHIARLGDRDRDEDGKVVIVLIVHHALTDGVGARNLLAVLLSELNAELRTVTKIETLETPAEARTTMLMPFPPTNEDTNDMQPSYAHLASHLWAGIASNIARVIPPSLPIISLFRPTVYTTWPNPPRGKPHLAAQRIASVRIPAAVLNAAKDVARQRGVRTLHPVMQAVTLVALRVAFLKNNIDLEEDARRTKPLQIKIATPASIRDKKLGHPHMCGNYVATFSHAYPLSSLGPYDRPLSKNEEAKAKFWDVALDFADDVTNPVKRQQAAAAIGMLAYLSDARTSTSTESATPAPSRELGSETGWVKFLRERMEAEAYFGASVELSNLGLFTTEEGCGVEQEEGFEVAWAQTSGPTGESIGLNVSATLDLSAGI